MKQGDIVKLKSGGPMMTIAEKFSEECKRKGISDNWATEDMWTCHWFNTDNELQTGPFHETELIASTWSSLPSQMTPIPLKTPEEASKYIQAHETADKCR